MWSSPTSQHCRWAALPSCPTSCLPSEGGGCSKVLCFFSLSAVPGNEGWQLPKAVFWQQQQHQEKPNGRTGAMQITDLKGMSLIHTSARLLSTSSSDCLSTRNLCLLFPTVFFISREMKTSQNSECQKHCCPVCAIIVLVRKLLNLLHYPMVYFAVRSTL